MLAAGSARAFFGNVGPKWFRLRLKTSKPRAEVDRRASLKGGHNRTAKGNQKLAA